MKEAEGDVMFAMRLLELEQKFESYCSIHEVELEEIRTSLVQLRKDILTTEQSGNNHPNIEKRIENATSPASSENNRKEDK
jgi:hypothetical protein